MDRRYGYSPVGQKILAVREFNIKESFSMTFLTYPGEDPPFAASIREGSNSQYDYGKFLADCIEGGWLKPGDVLVCDNAAVHIGNDTFDTILDGFDQLNIKMILLPQYSPEFNPSELCFAFLKNRLRSRRKNVPLIDDIILHLSSLTRRMLSVKMYRHCIMNPSITI
jgi:hypothetical protein